MLAKRKFILGRLRGLGGQQQVPLPASIQYSNWKKQINSFDGDVCVFLFSCATCVVGGASGPESQDAGG